MKYILTSLCALNALIFTALGAATAPTQGVVTKAGAADPAATNSVAIFGASDSGQAIKLASVQCVGDNAATVLQICSGGLSTKLSAAQTTAALTVVSTNIGIAAGAIVVLLDPDGDIGWGLVASTGASTITLDRDPGTFSSGSIVWAMTDTVSTTIGNATVTKDAFALYGGRKKSPLFLRCYCVAGTTELIKYATVEYYTPSD